MSATIVHVSLVCFPPAQK